MNERTSAYRKQKIQKLKMKNNKKQAEKIPTDNIPHTCASVWVWECIYVWMVSCLCEIQKPHSLKEISAQMNPNNKTNNTISHIQA